jgi:hypothetical protein
MATKPRSKAHQGKIGLAELGAKLADPRVKPELLSKYFVVDEKRSGPFDPALALNPATVDIPATADGKARADITLSSLNFAARMRRWIDFDMKIASGYQGPVIVSEGDSWFQYPFLLQETIDHLLARKYAIRSLDAAGDTLENMIETNEFAEQIVATGASVFLFSAGGNDVLGGGAIANYLADFDPGKSPAEHILPEFENLLGRAIAGYDQILRTVEKLPGDVLVICHGYDRPIPKKGRWLGKPMESRGIKDRKFQKRITDELIDRFNGRLKSLIHGYENARYVDLRNMIGPNENRWFDELHPTSTAFGDVGRRSTGSSRAPSRSVLRRGRPCGRALRFETSCATPALSARRPGATEFRSMSGSTGWIPNTTGAGMGRSKPARPTPRPWNLWQRRWDTSVELCCSMKRRRVEP